MPSYTEFELQGTPFIVREFAKKYHLRQDGHLVAEVPQLFSDEAEIFMNQLRRLYKLQDPQELEKSLNLAEAFETAKAAWRLVDWCRANDRSYILVDELFDRETGVFAFNIEAHAVSYQLMFIRIAATCGLITEHNMLIIVKPKVGLWLQKHHEELNKMVREGMNLNRLKEMLQELFGEKVTITE